MAKNKGGINNKVLMIGGGVIVVLALVLVGVYGKNLTTQTYNPASTPAVGAKCATQAEKDDATKQIKVLEGSNELGQGLLNTLNKSIIYAEQALLEDELSTKKLSSEELLKLHNEIDKDRAEMTRIQKLIAKNRIKIDIYQKILDLPLCKKPSPSPSPKSTPTPTPSKKPTPTPTPTPRPSLTPRPTTTPFPTPVRPTPKPFSTPLR